MNIRALIIKWLIKFGIVKPTFYINGAETLPPPLLRKNKKFYYNKKHFAAVSGMIYRMKQNAGGLASICVLSCHGCPC